MTSDQRGKTTSWLDMVVANSQHATSCLVCLSQTDGVMPCKDRVAGSPAAAVATAPARRRGRVVKVMASGLVHGFCGVNTRLAVGVGGMRAAQPAFRKNNNEKPMDPAALSQSADADCLLLVLDLVARSRSS